MDNQHRSVDEVIEAITRKLKENRPVLERSLHFGRVTWRMKDSKIEVKLELNV